MAMVLSAFVPDTIAQLRSAVRGEVTRQLCVTGEAKKLVRRLERAARALGDAERRAAGGDEGAGRWLLELRAAAYDADDIVDRCRLEARRLRGRDQQALPRLLSSCCDTGEPRDRINIDLKNLNLRMAVIIEKKGQLQLQPSVACTPERRVRHHKPRVLESDIVGKSLESDTDKLVKQLMEKGGQACGLLAIVGNDGVGKTTLAKKIYDDTRMQHAFDIRSWVYVSKDYTEASLLSKIVDSFGGDAQGTESISDLQSMLASLVARRRFLLVLDDVRYYEVWGDLLQKPLEQGAHGSKVLLTARHRSIVREMGAVHVHRVKKLSREDGWLLLCRASFLTEENDIETLKDVGRRIVDKCGGLPLAIRAVAGLLRTREAVCEEWGAVLESQAWSVKGLPEDVLRALYLCYDDLPSHLKQCFLYCSLFPSDCAMERHTLVQQWISEGFVQIRRHSCLEEVAQEYYGELIGRNLLQPETGYCNMERCRMHDLLWSLAQLVSQGEDLSCDVQQLIYDALFMPRRVSLPGKGMAGIPSEIKRLEGLRTLLLPMNPLTIEADVFTTMQHLKLLDLSETTIELLPETFGSLAFLRYLNLSKTSIQAIPESIGNMCSLKFLVLQECRFLHALPKGIENLKSLRDLDLAGTVIDDAPFRVGQLRNLTSLQCFVVTSKEACPRDREAWPLDELKHLFQLRTLHIHKLEKANDGSEAREALLDIKTCLKELTLSCSSCTRPLETMIRKVEEIYEELRPYQTLESLKIANYFGTKFPSWLSAIFLPNLHRVDLVSCNFCQYLPPLGRLPQLKSLYIADCSALKVIDAEFMGTGHHQQVPFPRLESLHLQGMHKLETWSDVEAGALPLLQALQLESCPELRYLPAGLTHATSLTELRILDAGSLKIIDNLVAVKELGVWNAPKLKRISDLPSLEDLNISYCPALKSVEKVNSLQAIHICDHDLQEMPGWIGLHASRLRSLDITGTVELLHRCLVDGADWNIIRDISQVYGYSGGANYISYQKSPFSLYSSLSSKAVEGVSQENQNISSAPSTVEIDRVDSTSSGAAPMAEDNMSVNTVEASSSKSRRRNRRTHKLAEVLREDSEVEAGTDSIVLFPSNSTRSPEGMANASITTIGKLIHGQSQAIGTYESGRGLRFSSARQNSLASSSPQDSRAKSIRIRQQTSAARSLDTVTRMNNEKVNKISHPATGNEKVTEVTKTVPAETVKDASVTASGAHSETNATCSPSNIVHEESPLTGFSGTRRDSPDNTVQNEQQISRKERDVDTRSTHLPDTVTRRSLEMADKICATTAATGKNQAVKGREVFVDAEATLSASAIHVHNAKNSNLTCGQSQASVSTNSTHGKLQTHMEGDAVADTTADRDDMVTRTILDMATKTSTAITSKSVSAETTTKFACAQTHAIDMVETSKKAEDIGASGTLSSQTSERICDNESKFSTGVPNSKEMDEVVKNAPPEEDAYFSIEVEADGSHHHLMRHRQPKVCTAIVADTDSECVVPFSSMQQYHNSAARPRRSRRRTYALDDRRTLGPRLMEKLREWLLFTLLFLSVMQLLFIFWLLQKPLNQK